MPRPAGRTLPAGVGWWVGWVQRVDQVTPLAHNLAMAGAADGPKHEQPWRASLRALGSLPQPSEVVWFFWTGPIVNL